MDLFLETYIGAGVVRLSWFSKLKLKQIIASSCRQKILLALFNVKSTCITNLVRITNSTYNQVDRNVVILEREGIVKTRKVGRLRIIELQAENSKAQTILKALRSLENLDEHTKNKSQ
jgi:predicted transcriptional regulator